MSHWFNNSINTGFSGNYGNHGNMFDILSNEDIIITGFEGNFYSGPVDLKIYYKAGTHIGYETDSVYWALVGTVNGLVPNPRGVPTPIPLQLNLPITAGLTYGFYITTTNGTNMAFNVSTSQGVLHTTDGILEFYRGTDNVYPFGSFGPRIWNGIIHYFPAFSIPFVLICPSACLCRLEVALGRRPHA